MGLGDSLEAAEVIVIDPEDLDGIRRGVIIVWIVILDRSIIILRGFVVIGAGRKAQRGDQREQKGDLASAQGGGAARKKCVQEHEKTPQKFEGSSRGARSDGREVARSERGVWARRIKAVAHIFPTIRQLTSDPKWKSRNRSWARRAHRSIPRKAMWQRAISWLAVCPPPTPSQFLLS